LVRRSQIPMIPVEVGHVCRSYDSCFVCTVHAHGARTGQEPRAFANRLIAQPWEKDLTAHHGLRAHDGIRVVDDSSRNLQVSVAGRARGGGLGSAARGAEAALFGRVGTCGSLPLGAVRASRISGIRAGPFPTPSRVTLEILQATVAQARSASGAHRVGCLVWLDSPRTRVDGERPHFADALR
jgi:hypothetical protein